MKWVYDGTYDEEETELEWMKDETNEKEETILDWMKEKTYEKYETQLEHILSYKPLHQGEVSAWARHKGTHGRHPGSQYLTL